MQTITFFDIETGPLPTEQILPLMPEFEAPGNIKDPEKIAAAIKAKQTQWLERAALSAISGEVLCVGRLEGDAFNYQAGTDEAATLAGWWQEAKWRIESGNTLVGFCCKMFDLPFLIRRSWALQVAIPGCIWNGRYFSDRIFDIAERWECGVRGGEHISLDSLAKFLGIGQKNGDGKDFASLWNTNKPAALAYLEHDLRLTKAAYHRLFNYL